MSIGIKKCKKYVKKHVFICKYEIFVVLLRPICENIVENRWYRLTMTIIIIINTLV